MLPFWRTALKKCCQNRGTGAPQPVVCSWFHVQRSPETGLKGTRMWTFPCARVRGGWYLGTTWESLGGKSWGVPLEDSTATDQTHIATMVIV